MLIPAIARKDELEQLYAEHLYDKDMFFYNGYPYCNTMPEFIPRENIYKRAIVDNKTSRVIGYFTYMIETNSDNVCSFGLYSFDRGNPLIGIDVYRKMKELIKNHRRIEWRMIGDNPVEKYYDKLCDRFNGHKVILFDVVKDNEGNYHNECIYEIVKPRWLYE